MNTTFKSSARALLAAVGIVSVSSLGAIAQEARAPNGPIEITVPSSAGSTPDVLMRRAAKIWNEEKIIEQPVVVVNRPGGAWMVGMNYVLERPGDENNVLAFAEPTISTPIAQGLEPVYDKLTTLGIFVQTQLVVVAQPDHPANSLAELVAIAKDKPREVKVSGANAASTDAQVMALIEKAADVDLTYIPHDGGGAAQATFLGGNTDLITLTIDEALPLIESNKGKALAILNEERRPEDKLKDIPTAKEQGIDVVWGQVFGLSGAPQLDPAVVKWWDEKIAALVESDAWKTALADNFLGGKSYPSAEATAFVAEMHRGRQEILRAIGVAKN
ncbi:Bug family tripartite tricarboxylate transporter substrate binding protein [Faunimonas sp. B44]|uniref:Bug family tripartite tricarboxylate transporter substrate binding protein n=1 Tax=Faunimonas sp. B44 TaxID=3461493 RepID=UPI004043CE65